MQTRFGVGITRQIIIPVIEANKDMMMVYLRPIIPEKRLPKSSPTIGPIRVA